MRLIARYTALYLIRFYPDVSRSLNTALIVLIPLLTSRTPVIADDTPLNTRKISTILILLPVIHIMNSDIRICILPAVAISHSF